MTEEELIRGCMKREPAAQRELYLQYFSRSMNTCVRYSRDAEGAKAILLDAFRNILNNFRDFYEINSKNKKDAPAVSLEEWIFKAVISSAVQHMHDKKKEHFVSSTVSMRDTGKKTSLELSDEQIIQATDKKMILKALQQLTPSYRAIYNLHEVDGFSHAEISKLLDISEYISKDSLLKAKFNLRNSLCAMIPNQK